MTLSVNLALAQRLERVEAINTAGYAESLQKLQPGSAAAVQAIGDGLAVFTRPDFPMNRAVGIGLAENIDAAGLLAAVELFYHSHQTASQIMICPFTQVSLLQLLGQHGYFAEHFYNVHVRAITPEDADVPEPSAIRVSIVEPPDFDLWARTNIGTAREFAEVPADDVWFTLCKVAVRRPHVLGFIAWVEGEPAGSAALSILDGVATLFSAGTRTRFRRRGVQKALLHARLATAHRHGCDLAHLTTTPGSDSQRNVQRAGFALAYQRITMQQNRT